MESAAIRPIARAGSSFRRVLFGLYGALIAVIAWWLIDHLAAKQLQGLAIGEPAGTHLIGIVIVVVVSTVAVLLSRVALLTSIGVIVLGIILGGSGSWEPIVTLPDNDAHFTLLRGAAEPAVWALAAVWLTIAIWSFIISRRESRRPHR